METPWRNSDLRGGWHGSEGHSRCRVCRVPGEYGGARRRRVRRVHCTQVPAKPECWGEICRGATRGRGANGGLGEASLLVAGTEAVLRPAQPRKLEIEGGDGFGGSLGEARDRRDRLRRWGGGGAHAGAPVTRTSPAAARSHPAQLGGSLTEQKIRLVVAHVLSLHHIHCSGGAHEQAESTGRAQILAMTRRWSPRVATGVGSQKTGVDPSAGLCGRRTEGAQVQAYRRLDTLPAGRMSRGHFYSSTMLKRCSPLGAPMRAL